MTATHLRSYDPLFLADRRIVWSSQISMFPCELLQAVNKIIRRQNKKGSKFASYGI